MSSRYHKRASRAVSYVGIGVLCLSLGVTACGPAHAATTVRELRVCSDPNNLPFSNERQEGFEIDR